MKLTLEKGKEKFSKKIVRAVLFRADVYVLLCFGLAFWKQQQMDTQVTIAYFAFLTTELWNLAKIKRSENEKGDDENGDQGN